MKDRLFIAIPAKIEKFQSLKRELEHLVEGKYSLEEQLHLTVVFLGDQFSEEMISANLESVDLTFERSPIMGMGYFNQSKVLVGLCQNDSIKALRERICQALKAECRGDYHLHVTLMRVKKILDIEKFQKLTDDVENPIGSLESKLILYRSHLSSEGALYVPLREFDI